MHDLRTIFRNSLLFCAIVTNFCFISLSFAHLDTTYEVGGITRKSEFIPNPAGANGSKGAYASSSASKMPNGTRIPYGLRGTLRTSSKLFKQLILVEGGLELYDWIKSQYTLSENTDLDVQTMTITQKIPVQGYICGNGCYYTADIVGCTSINAITSLNCALRKANYSGNTNKRIISVNCQENACTADYVYVWEDGSEQIIGRVRSYPVGDNSDISSWTDFAETTYPAGEPNRLPDPWKTGQIVEYYAAKIPQAGADGWEAYISPNVQILDQPIRWTELPAPAGLPTVDTVTDLIRVPGYEPNPPAVIPDPEPLRPDPDGLKKIPNPLLQGLPDPTTPYPPPAVRTQDLIGGGMTVTNTYNITNNATQTKVELNLENKEITYTQDDSEIEVPKDLSIEEIESNLPRLKVPTLEPEKLVDAAFNAAGNFIVPDILDDKTSSCPPPRNLAIIGGATVQMPFDPLCDFLAMIKKVFVPVVGWIIFLMWIRRIGSS